jgi:hypothetical protein
MNAQEKAYYKMVILGVLSSHQGKARAIGMGELFEQVFGEPWTNRINDTRKLRKLIREIKKEMAAPIGSTSAQTGGGYYLASGSELEDYCRRRRRAALRILSEEARLRRVALPELVGQMLLNFEA